MRTEMDEVCSVTNPNEQGRVLVDASDQAKYIALLERENQDLREEAACLKKRIERLSHDG